MRPWRDRRFTSCAGVALVTLILVGCYDAPKPACGFECGAAGACPVGYSCAADSYCHLDGSSTDLSCPVLDASIDAEPEIPVVIDVVPHDNALGVNVEATLLATFNKPVTGVSAASFTLTLRDSSTPVAAVVSYDPTTRTASLHPSVPLYSSKAYDVMLSAEITDRNSIPITGTTRWSFLTAADSVPPVVVATSPSDGATNVGVDVTVVATFSESVSNTTATSVLLEGPAGSVLGTVGYVSQTAIRFSPTLQLTPHTIYTATLTSAISDLGGNSLAPPFTWTFATGADTIAPLIVTVNPVEDDVDVPVTTTVTAHFSEPMIGVSIDNMTLDQGGILVPAAVTYVASTRTARLVPAAPLLSNTTYSVRLSDAITDTSGNALPGAPVTWMFTTIP
jgi:hypothetical protein